MLSDCASWTSLKFSEPMETPFVVMSSVMIAVSDSVKSIVTTRLEFWTTESADISGSAVAANANVKAKVRDAVDLFIW